ncbi:MAG: tetratricopeptide repeat protein, partial [Candidatus Thorarchaeota archaeon]
MVAMSSPEIPLKEVEEYLKIHPDDAMAWNTKGVLLATLGDFGPALRALNEAIKLNADLHQAHTNKGRVLLALGSDKASEALKSFDTALRLKPNDLDALRDKAVALRALDRLAEEMRCLLKFVDLAPQEWKAWMRIGDIQLESGDFRQAESSFSRVLELEAENVFALIHRAIALSMLEEWGDAIKSAEEACKHAPDQVEAWKVLGDVNVRAGRNRAALKALEKAARLDPEDAHVELTLGMVEYKSGRLKDAVKHFNRAIIRDRKNPRGYRNIALVSMELEEWEASKDAWERFIQLVKNDAEAYDALATSCARLDDFCCAADAWDMARKLFKKNGQNIDASRVTELGRAARINCSRMKKALKAQKEHEKATRTFSDRHKGRSTKR